jgi:hypothetical protein
MGGKVRDDPNGIGGFKMPIRHPGCSEEILGSETPRFRDQAGVSLKWRSNSLLVAQNSL